MIPQASMEAIPQSRERIGESDRLLSQTIPLPKSGGNFPCRIR